MEAVTILRPEGIGGRGGGEGERFPESQRGNCKGGAAPGSSVLTLRFAASAEPES